MDIWKTEKVKDKPFTMKDNYTLANKNKKKDEFLPTMNAILAKARWIGIPTDGGRCALCWAIIMLLMLVTIVVGAIWKLVRLLIGIARNPTEPDVMKIAIAKQRYENEMSNVIEISPTPVRFHWNTAMQHCCLAAEVGGVIARLSGTIFYANGLLSFVILWRFVTRWRILSSSWLGEEMSVLYIPPDRFIRKRVMCVTVYVTICACVEHMLSMMSATGFDCTPQEYFKKYILSSHGFLIHPSEYSLWVAIPVFLLSQTATILWNLQDLIIILLSMGLASRYHRLNTLVRYLVRCEKRAKFRKKVVYPHTYRLNQWRRVREAYVRQAAMVRRVDEDLGALILLSNCNNLYFICLQLYLGLRNMHMSVLSTIYYFTSLAWLLFRACSVVLSAADVNLHSKRALIYLDSCPSSSYNIEIKRLQNQLTYDDIVLSGKKLFYLHRHTLLQVAAMVLKYELILIQYDN